MKKILVALTLLVSATMMYAECYYVSGTIITYKMYYDANKQFLYEEEERSENYFEKIEASSKEDAKAKAMRECENMCRYQDDVREIRENGKVIGYYRLMRRTRIDSCYQC